MSLTKSLFENLSITVPTKSTAVTFLLKHCEEQPAPHIVSAKMVDFLRTIRVTI